MPGIQIKGSVATLASELRQLEKRIAPIAAQCLNTAARDTTAYARRLVRESLMLKAWYVSKHLGIGWRASPSSLNAGIEAWGRAVLLNRYKTKTLKTRVKHPKRSKGNRRYAQDEHYGINIPAGYKLAGLQNHITRGGANVKWRNAFVMRFKKNGAIAFVTRQQPWRKGEKLFQSKNTGAIHVHWGPSVYQHFQLREDEIKAFAKDKLTHEIKRRLGI